MAIEAIKGAGMAYQGSVSTAEVKAETGPKVESASNETASNAIAKETGMLNAKSIDADSPDSGDEGNGYPQGEAKKSQKKESDERIAAQNAQIKKKIDEMNKKAISNSEAIFGIHDKTNRVTIKIVDKQTKEVLKEYPPEKTLDMIAKAWEMAGIMVDEKL